MFTHSRSTQREWSGRRDFGRASKIHRSAVSGLQDKRFFSPEAAREWILAEKFSADNPRIPCAGASDSSPGASCKMPSQPIRELGDFGLGSATSLRPPRLRDHRGSNPSSLRRRVAAASSALRSDSRDLPLPRCRKEPIAGTKAFTPGFPVWLPGSLRSKEAGGL